MKKMLLLAMIGSFAAAPAFAQRIEFIGRVAWISTTAEGVLEGRTDTNPVRIEIDDKSGWGGAVNLFLTNRFSLEVGASWVEPEVLVSVSDDIVATLRGARITMIPLTAVLQYHTGGRDRPWDLYFGAGVAYVLFSDVEGRVDEVGGGDLRRIDFENDYGVVGNVGLNLLLADHITFNLDAKYVPVKSSANAVFATGPERSPTEISINPLIISAGIGWRF
jgi:outer membrane protein W